MTYELHYQAHMQGLEHHSLRSMATQGTFPRTSIQTVKYPNCQLSDDIFFGQIFSGYLPNPKITKTSGVRWVLGVPLLGLGGSTIRRFIIGEQIETVITHDTERTVNFTVCCGAPESTTAQ